MSGVYKLVYVSSASNSFVPADIKSILEKARTTNPSLGVTGLLLFRSGIFVQLLEGDKENVTLLYDKIQQDPRHGNVIKILEKAGEPRLFEDWSMAYRQVTDLDIAMVNEILSWNKLINVARDIDNNLIMHLLARFKKGLESSGTGSGGTEPGGAS